MSNLTLTGKNNTASVFTENIGESAIGQIIGMLNEPITENTTVAIMPVFITSNSRHDHSLLLD